MLFKGILGTQMSGAIDGIVASHNAGGTYFRARVTPTNPNTSFQGVVRDAVASLTNQWVDALSTGQRFAWEIYADNVTVTNRIGDQINISGLAHYVRANVARIQAGVAEIITAPSVFSLGSHSRPSLQGFGEAGQAAEVAFTVDPFSDEWANVAGGFMFVYLSRPQNVSINFFRGPYRLAATIVGDPVPPVSPQVITVPFPITEGQRVFGRAVSTNADGRYSTSSFIGPALVAA